MGRNELQNHPLSISHWTDNFGSNIWHNHRVNTYYIYSMHKKLLHDSFLTKTSDKTPAVYMTRKENVQSNASQVSCHLLNPDSYLWKRLT
jgi:hypothetical protein